MYLLSRLDISTDFPHIKKTRTKGYNSEIYFHLIENMILGWLCFLFLFYFFDQNQIMLRGRRGRNRMIVGFTTTCAISGS